MKLKLISCLFLLSATCSPAWASDWIYVGKNDSASKKVYVNLQSLNIETKDWLTFWTRIDFSPSDDFNGKKVTQQFNLREVNCSTRMAKNLGTVLHYDDASVDTGTLVTFAFIEPDTLAFREYDFVCNGKRPGLKGN